jgi:hypothetical protein
MKPFPTEKNFGGGDEESLLSLTKVMKSPCHSNCVCKPAAAVGLWCRVRVRVRVIGS